MMRLPSRRRSAVALLAAVGAGAGFTFVPAAGAAPVLPVLWEGQVQAPGGASADNAEVVAYARPPADALKAGVPITEIGRSRTDDDGRFVLRAAPASVAGVADDGGWASVMVVATGAEGMALAVDSVSWKPATAGLAPFSLGSAGSWVSTPHALLADPRTLSVSAAETPDALAVERPRVLTLERNPLTMPLAKRPGGRAPKGETHCAPTPRYTDVGVFPVAVGELHREAGWGGEFVYSSTRSSSFQVGGSADGTGWKMSGSTSMSKSDSGSMGGYEEPTDHLEFQTMYAPMVFTRFEWVCGEPNWYKAYTLEPTDWTGGIHDWPGVNPTSCLSGKTIPVPDGDFFNRHKGSSQTLDRAISVDGFVGAVSTGFTMAVSANDTQSVGVGEKWLNVTSRERYLCGDRDFPIKNTRIVSLP